ncbi:MAG: restriction endonuclease [Chloroflexi bacterium]|nr:restriction endonuclease [Chloroflexota bacterium]
MGKDKFLLALQEEAKAFTEAVATEKGDWIVKGFIDVYKRVYTISVDTKVISKVLELLLFPKLADFAKKYDYEMVISSQQNFYPDISFIDRETGNKYAVDIKSTYRTDSVSVNGMTLGAFTGYFHDRNSHKNIVFPYKEYKSHIVLGVIYSKAEEFINERNIHSLDELEKINSVIKDFVFFAQPKYRIASSLPGSGNTKNIGSVTRIEQLINGTGPFSELGEHIYDDYWMFYLTNDMARAAETNRPYQNLVSYSAYKNLNPDISIETAKRLEDLDTNFTKEAPSGSNSTSD